MKKYELKDLKTGMKFECVNSKHDEFWTKGKVYEIDGDLKITDEEGDIRAGLVLVALINGEFETKFEEIVEEKRYKVEDLRAGMKLVCTNNGGKNHWTTGKVYTLDVNLKLFDNAGDFRNSKHVARLLNGFYSAKFKVVDYSEKEELYMRLGKLEAFHNGNINHLKKENKQLWDEREKIRLELSMNQQKLTELSMEVNKATEQYEMNKKEILEKLKKL